MSRRERISDFTRSSQNTRSGVNRHVFNRDQQNRISRHNIESPKLQVRKIERQKVQLNPVIAKPDKSRVLQRQGLKKLPPFTPIVSKKRVSIKKLALGLSVVVSLLVVPMLIYVVVANRSDFAKNVTSKYFAQDTPKYLSSRAITDVSAKILPIDSIDNSNSELTDTGSIGWYKRSAKPGKPGAVLLTGFVSGDNNTGIFKEITKMKQGDAIQIETDDGQIVFYKVVSVQKYLPQDVDEEIMLQSAEEGKEGLNMISYTDRLNQNTDMSMYRYAVFATKMD